MGAQAVNLQDCLTWNTFGFWDTAIEDSFTLFFCSSSVRRAGWVAVCTTAHPLVEGNFFGSGHAFYLGGFGTDFLHTICQRCFIDNGLCRASAWDSDCTEYRK
jgi:hypothetical protein